MRADRPGWLVLTTTTALLVAAVPPAPSAEADLPVLGRETVLTSDGTACQDVLLSRRVVLDYEEELPVVSKYDASRIVDIRSAADLAGLHLEGLEGATDDLHVVVARLPFDALDGTVVARGIENRTQETGFEEHGVLPAGLYRACSFSTGESVEITLTLDELAQGRTQIHLPGNVRFGYSRNDGLTGGPVESPHFNHAISYRSNRETWFVQAAWQDTPAAAGFISYLCIYRYQHEALRNTVLPGCVGAEQGVGLNVVTPIAFSELMHFSLFLGVPPGSWTVGSSTTTAGVNTKVGGIAYWMEVP